MTVGNKGSEIKEPKGFQAEIDKLQVEGQMHELGFMGMDSVLDQALAKQVKAVGVKTHTV